MDILHYIQQEFALQKDDKQRFSFKHIDRTYWALLICLVGAALVALYSASSTVLYGFTGTINPVMKQMIIILFGCALAFVMQFMPTWTYRIVGYLVLGGSILALYVILIVSMLHLDPNHRFVVVANGAARWIKLFGITIQPSEFAKVGLVIVMADLLQKMKLKGDEDFYFRIMIGITALTCFPIFVGNLSSVILICIVIFLMWLLAGVHWRKLVLVVGVTLALAIVGFLVADFGYVRRGKQLPPLFSRAETWVERLDQAFHFGDATDGTKKEIDPYEITDKNYQASMAKIAIARGHFLGVMPGNSKMRDYLPLAYMDYIFAIIVEETGFWGSIFLIFVYLAILFRACLTSSQFEDKFAMLMVMGLGLMLCCQALISMLVAVGLGPVTGQPLPLITQGGTSALATCIYFGIMMGVSREQASFRAQQKETKERSLNDLGDIDIQTDSIEPAIENDQSQASKEIELIDEIQL